MPFSRPTLTQLRAQASSDIAAALPGADALLRYSNLAILGTMLSGMASGHYGYLDWIALQATPFTCTDEYLDAWAALKGITRKPGTRAGGMVAFAGADGATVLAGTLVGRGDGFGYTVAADAIVAGGTAIVAIVAAVSKAAGNAATGTAFTLQTSVSGVSSTGLATGPITGGADIEPDDELRTRMLAAYAAPPQGGAETDYIGWALAIPGVTRAWVTPSGMGPGSVCILFMMDDAEAGAGGFPQGVNGVASAETRDTAATGDQLIVANGLFPLQPVTALAYAVAPISNVIALTIAGIVGASASIKSAIAVAFGAALRSAARPGGSTPVSAIEGAIAAVAGSAGFVISAITATAGTVSPGAAGNITSNAGALPVAGAISYTA